MADKKKPTRKNRVKPSGAAKKAAARSRTAGPAKPPRQKTAGPSRPGAAVREGEERFRDIFQYAVLGIFISTLDGKFIDVNPALARMMGYDSPGQVLSAITNIATQVYADSLKRDAVATQALEAGGTITTENRYLRKDGTIWHGLLHLRIVKDKQGRPAYYEGFIEDITGRKRVEEARNESETRFRAVFERNNDGITVADLEGRYVMVNDIFCRMTGYSRDELLKMRVHDLLPGHVKLQLFIQVAVQKQSGRREIELRRKDGSTFPVSISGAVLEVGEKQFVQGIVQDITERKLSEESLAESKRRLSEALDFNRSILKTSSIGVLAYDATGQCIFSNEAAAETAGTNVAGLLLQNYHRIESWKKNGMYEAALRALSTDKEQQSEDHIITTFGKDIWLNLRYSTFYSKGEKHLLLLFYDITERKLAEEKIRQSEGFIRSILDTVDEGFIVIDKDYRILTANKAYCDQVARPCYDIIGKPCFEISHNINRPCYEEGEECAVQQVFATGKPHAVLHKHSDRDGHVLYVETKGFPIKDASGNVTSVIETINNITEKHLLEEERLKTQKLESIGTLAGGIAHDFNNLLQGIFGYISMARITLDQREKSLAMLEQAEKALQQSVNLTTQLLTFSKGGKPLKKPMSLGPVIESSVKFALSGSRTEYKLNIDRGLWYVNGDSGQLGQVVQNIVLNAGQAMPMGGSISITARNAPAGDASPPSVLAIGDYVEISIQDNGVGIPEQYLEKIFDPYFTTKEKGSGLGLATAYSIVRNHGGVIDVKTKIGAGTTFSIYLPAELFCLSRKWTMQPSELMDIRMPRIGLSSRMPAASCFSVVHGWL